MISVADMYIRDCIRLIIIYKYYKEALTHMKSISINTWSTVGLVLIARIHNKLKRNNNSTPYTAASTCAIIEFAM